MTASLDTTASLLASLRTILAALSQNATFPADVAMARDVARAAIAKHGGDAQAQAQAQALVAEREIPERELNALCEASGIRLVQASEDETRGLWDWVDDSASDACDQSFATRAEAALDALSRRFKEDWDYQVVSGNTRRGLLDWIGAEALA